MDTTIQDIFMHNIYFGTIIFRLWKYTKQQFLTTERMTGLICSIVLLFTYYIIILMFNCNISYIYKMDLHQQV